MIRPSAGGVRIDLRVIPRASSSEIAGVRDGRLLVRVTAPPVDAAANEAVIALLAAAFDVPKRGVRITAGATSRAKTVEVATTEAAVRSRLSAILN